MIFGIFRKRPLVIGKLCSRPIIVQYSVRRLHLQYEIYRGAPHAEIARPRWRVNALLIDVACTRVHQDGAHLLVLGKLSQYGRVVFNEHMHENDGERKWRLCWHRVLLLCRLIHGIAVGGG